MNWPNNYDAALHDARHEYSGGEDLQRGQIFATLALVDAVRELTAKLPDPPRPLEPGELIPRPFPVEPA